MYRIAECNFYDIEEEVEELVSALLSCMIEVCFGKLNDDGQFVDTDRLVDFLKRSKNLGFFVDEKIIDGEGLLAEQIPVLKLVTDRYADILVKIQDKNYSYTFDPMGEALIFEMLYAMFESNTLPDNVSIDWWEVYKEDHHITDEDEALDDEEAFHFILYEELGEERYEQLRNSIIEKSRKRIKSILKSIYEQISGLSDEVINAPDFELEEPLENCFWLWKRINKIDYRDDERDDEWIDTLSEFIWRHYSDVCGYTKIYGVMDYQRDLLEDELFQFAPGYFTFVDKVKTPENKKYIELIRAFFSNLDHCFSSTIIWDTQWSDCIEWFCRSGKGEWEEDEEERSIDLFSGKKDFRSPRNKRNDKN